jgi:hypothetical protein
LSPRTWAHQALPLIAKPDQTAPEVFSPVLSDHREESEPHQRSPSSLIKLNQGKSSQIKAETF